MKVQIEAEGGSSTAESRERLLEAAGQLMAERGTTDISLSEIAARSGVNSALVKYYFGNKAGMLMALLRRRLGQGMADLQQLLKMDISPQDKLRIHISGMVNTYYQYPYVNRLMHELANEPSGDYGKQIAEEISLPVAKAQRAILEERRAKGICREVDPLVFYFMIVGACDQLFHSRHQARHVFGLEEINDDLKRRYVSGLCNNLIRGISADPRAN